LLLESMEEEGSLTKSANIFECLCAPGPTNNVSARLAKTRKILEAQHSPDPGFLPFSSDRGHM
jgi:hypothetical protein